MSSSLTVREMLKTFIFSSICVGLEERGLVGIPRAYCQLKRT